MWNNVIVSYLYVVLCHKLSISLHMYPVFSCIIFFHQPNKSNNDWWNESAVFNWEADGQLRLRQKLGVRKGLGVKQWRCGFWVCDVVFSRLHEEFRIFRIGMDRCIASSLQILRRVQGTVGTLCHFFKQLLHQGRWWPSAKRHGTKLKNCKMRVRRCTFLKNYCNVH